MWRVALPGSDVLGGQRELFCGAAQCMTPALVHVTGISARFTRGFWSAIVDFTVLFDCTCPPRCKVACMMCVAPPLWPAGLTCQHCVMPACLLHAFAQWISHDFEPVCLLL